MWVLWVYICAVTKEELYGSYTQSGHQDVPCTLGPTASSRARSHIMASQPPAKRPRDESKPAAPEQRCRYLRFENLPHGCTSSELQALLDPLGKVEDIRVARSGGGGMLALVEMSCTREAVGAKRQLNQLPLRGSALTVSFDSARSDAPKAPAAEGNGNSQAQAPRPAGPPAPAINPNPVPAFPGNSKLPPFYVPDRMLRDINAHQVIKMRSVLWTAKEDDIRDFYRGLPLDRDAIEMGKDHAGRFSGMVYVRFRSSADANAALRRGAEYLCGRSVILSRVDMTTPGILRPGVDLGGTASAPRFGDGSAGAAPRARPPPVFEQRPWPPPGGAKAAPKKPAGPPPKGYVGVTLTVGDAEKGAEPSLSAALANAPVGEALAAVRHFLTKDERLPGATRSAAAFLDTLRSKLLENPAQSEGSPIGKSLFRSPFEQAGVLGYSLPEVEHIFGTRSSDSVFWPIFSTFHTLLPHEIDDKDEKDESLEDFIAG